LVLNDYQHYVRHSMPVLKIWKIYSSSLWQLVW